MRSSRFSPRWSELEEMGCPDHLNRIQMFHAKVDEIADMELPVAFTSATSSIRCLLSAIALGMGIQIPDIEQVPHWGSQLVNKDMKQVITESGCKCIRNLVLEYLRIADENIPQGSDSDDCCYTCSKLLKENL